MTLTKITEYLAKANFVLNDDYTQVDDENSFKSLPDNTLFMLTSLY